MSEATLKLGDSLPENIKFGWIPPAPENQDIKACGIPITYNASKGKPTFPVTYSPPLFPRPSH